MLIQKIVSTAFIHKEGKLLIVKRSESKELFPGDYEMPGGKLEFGEDAKEALKREIMEELGVDVSVFEPFHCFTYFSNDRKTQYVEIVFFAELADIEENIKLNDHTDMKWVVKEDLASYKMSDESREIMAKGFDLRSH